jgi:SAM-dependent methyltransferase
MDQWPKQRPNLPREYLSVYEDHMAINRGGRTTLNRASLWLEEWMHRSVASPVGRVVLELGAGNLNHRRFEPDAVRYDAIEPLADVAMAARSSATHPWEYLGDYDTLIDLAMASATTYDKVVSVAVLEHLEDLPAVVAASALLLSPAGTFAAGIPSEGGFLWRAAWKATTGRAFRRRYDLDYATLMAWEHINTAHEITEVISALFDRVWIRRFPGPTLSTSLYTAIHAQNPDLEAARTLLAQRRSST